MAQPLLKVSAIQAHYGRVRALHDVSLEVAEGSIVALLGSNGAGKTTTLRVISGLLRPSHGAVEFDGRRIERLRPDQLVCAGIAHVPEGRQLFPELTVRENLRLGAYTRRDARTVEQDLQRVFNYFPRLRERLGQNAGTLSGGEQQMLAIARGLMSRPKLLILDEFSLGLAPLVVKEIFGILQEVNRQGTTIFLVEQNVQRSLSISHRSYVLENGAIVLHGEGKELLKNEYMKKAFLGM
jgi:branched-chain amino acid transport system ATP-binding protein